MYRSGNVERNDEGLATTLDTFMKRKTATATSTVEPCSYLTDEQVMYTIWAMYLAPSPTVSW